MIPIRFLTPAVLLVASSFAAAGGAETKRPNFVFFLVDDLGYMDIGAYNPHTFYETPNVDRIAKHGMRFTDGYAANPVCSPTRYSIMTGRHPSRVDATNFFAGRRAERFHPAPLNDRMALEEVTLAEALQQAGYSTAFLGKWHLGPTEEFWPRAQGFDINVAGYSAGGPFKCGYFSPYYMPTITDGPVGEHLPERLSRDACDIIDKLHDSDTPFLVYLSFYSVHTPLNAPQDLVEKYKRKAAALPDAGAPEFADEEQVWPTNRPRRVRIRQCHAVYAAMIESMDQAVGRVIDKLDDLGIADNTVILFMSDNGGLSTSEGSPTSNLPLRGGKGWLYEGGIREPYIIRWPGVTEPGSTCGTPVNSTDFYPTMLEIASLEPKPAQHQDGASLVPLLTGKGTINREALYWHYPHYSNQGGIPGAAIRMGRYKLIERFEDGRVHLYDLEDDIGEQSDLAEKMPDKVGEMKKKLHAWYQEVGAKFLQPKPGGPLPWRPGD
jgi:arylsulfatase A-like enzyme